MKKLLAYIISYLFHPALFFLLMPFLLVYRQTGSILYALKWQIFSSAFIFLGVILIFMEIIRGDFSDFDITKKDERLRFYVLLLILGILYITSATYFKGVLFPLSIISIGLSVGVILFAILNRFIKSSVHFAVACAFIITNSILFGIKAFYLTVWIIPFVVWARIVLKKHTIFETLMGGFLGIIVTLGTFLLAKYLLV